jgi:hypothetical protein
MNELEVRIPAADGALSPKDARSMDVRRDQLAPPAGLFERKLQKAASTPDVPDTLASREPGEKFQVRDELGCAAGEVSQTSRMATQVNRRVPIELIHPAEERVKRVQEPIAEAARFPVALGEKRLCV